VMEKHTGEGWLKYLLGKSVTFASLEAGVLVLSDGTRLVFDKENWSCCSQVDLTGLATTANVITAAELQDDEDEADPVGEYRAWVHVVTEAGELNLAEADGDASNGCYLHGFALGVTVVPPV
jgi:hypothetical protein